MNYTKLFVFVSMKLMIIKASSLITMQVEIEIIVAMDVGNH